jgi:uncharacterized membrane protein
MKWKYVGIAFVFLWFVIGSVCHFLLTDTFVRTVPPYIPWPQAAVYVSGVFELLGAIGILIPRVRSAAGICLIVLTICVTPANVYMWMHAERFAGFPPALLAGRLAFQIVLLWLIWWSTRSNGRNTRRRPRSALDGRS